MNIMIKSLPMEIEPTTAVAKRGRPDLAQPLTNKKYMDADIVAK